MTRGTKGLRRRAPRLKTRLDGSLVGRSTRDVEVVDLSLTGCLVRCGASFDHGAILDLSLRLGGGPFTAKVRVREAFVDGAALAEEVPRYLVGLEFLGLPAEGEARLRSFLEDERRRGRGRASGP